MAVCFSTRSVATGWRQMQTGRDSSRMHRTASRYRIDVGPWTALLAPPEDALLDISLRELANMTDIAIGIDLGTTYRCAARSTC
jgi:hypothetical protein